MSDKDQIDEVNEWMRSALRNVMDGCQAIANNFAIINETGITSVTIIVADAHMGDGIKHYLEETYGVDDEQPE